MQDSILATQNDFDDPSLPGAFDQAVFDAPGRNGTGRWPELPMPKGSNQYMPWSQQILRAARSGRILKRPEGSWVATGAGAQESTAHHQLDGESGTKSDQELRGLVAKRWVILPRHLEETEHEYLAKRRKGLPKLPVDGAVVMQNGDMVNIETDEPLRKRMPPPRRKPKRGPGRGKKKIVDTPGEGVSASAEALAASKRARAQEEGGDDANDQDDMHVDDKHQDGEDDEGEDEEGEEGDDDDREEGELSPSPDKEDPSIALSKFKTPQKEEESIADSAISLPKQENENASPVPDESEPMSSTTLSQPAAPLEPPGTPMLNTELDKTPPRPQDLLEPAVSPKQEPFTDVQFKPAIDQNAPYGLPVQPRSSTQGTDDNDHPLATVDAKLEQQTKAEDQG